MLRAVRSLGMVRILSGAAIWASYKTAARKFERAVLHLWAQHAALDANL